MIVVGRVTGTHLIEDIRVAVPHNVAVPITPDQMIHSKDLHRALNQGFIFKIDGGAFHSTSSRVPMAGQGEIAKLKKENKELCRQLGEARMRNEGLQRALVGLNTNIDGILTAIGSLKDNGGKATPVALPPNIMQVFQQLVTQGRLQVGAAPSSEAVGGDVPVFIQDEIKPKDAETNIQIEKVATEGSDVSASTKKLRELRQDQKPG